MNKNVAAILAILLGSFGAHKFYMGKHGKGFLYLLFSWTWIPGIIGIIEGISYLCMSKERFNSKYDECYGLKNNEKADSKFKGLFTLKGINGQLYVYENKIIIERKGGLATLTHGFSGSKTIPMSSINSVQFKEGGLALNGYLQFAVAGGIERQGGVFNSVDDENSIMFSASSNKLAAKINDYINDKIAERGTPQATTIVQSNVSVADELLKFKTLLDQNLISQEEFDRKRDQLLK